MVRKRKPAATERDDPSTSRQSHVERIVRVSELCAKLGVSRQGLFKMRRRGDLPSARRYGPNVVGWPESVIADWFASRPAA
jgi:predicted DNA-binding transcriptional regulator AlpA